jgi:ribosomal protein S18 acetylase RimI-like enzyme
MKLEFTTAAESDFERLVELRIQVMRESLERINRFDPVRARERFRAGFDPSQLRLVHMDGDWVGCVSLKDRGDHLEIEHFYIKPQAQGQGIGSAVLRMLIEEAGPRTIRLGVLKQSRAADFYRRHGFVKTGEEEFDETFERRASSPA